MAKGLVRRVKDLARALRYLRVLVIGILAGCLGACDAFHDFPLRGAMIKNPCRHELRVLYLVTKVRKSADNVSLVVPAGRTTRTPRVFSGNSPYSAKITSEGRTHRISTSRVNSAGVVVFTPPNSIC